MALTVLDAGVSVFDTTNQTTYTTASFTPAANDRLYVKATSTGAAVTAISLSDSLSSTFAVEIATQAGGPNNGWSGLWSLDVGASPAARTITLTATGGATGGNIQVWRVAGSGLSTKQAKRVTGSGANPAITMASALSTGNAYCAWISEDVGVNGQWTAGVMASWTVDRDTGYATPTTRSGAAHRVNGETGSTLTWTNANTGNWLFTVVEVQEGTVYNDSGSGTITLAGATTESASGTDSRAGTITLGGASTESYTIAQSAIGTVTIGGSGFDSWSVGGSSYVSQAPFVNDEYEGHVGPTALAWFNEIDAALVNGGSGYVRRVWMNDIYNRFHATALDHLNSMSAALANPASTYTAQGFQNDQFLGELGPTILAKLAVIEKEIDRLR